MIVMRFSSVANRYHKGHGSSARTLRRRERLVTRGLAVWAVGLIMVGMGLAPALAGQLHAATPDGIRLDRDFRHGLTMAMEPRPEDHWTFGPLFERARWAEGSDFFAVRPLFSHGYETDTERYRFEFLWPVMSWRTVDTMRSGRVLLAFIQDFDANDPQSQSRLWILPLFFSGHGRDGEPYTAVFPLVGKIRDILGNDEARFFLFPLYAETRKGTTATRHFLWPIVAVTEGEQQHRWRVFPLYGQAQESDGTVRRFVLWPFFSSVQREGTHNDGGGFVLFPLFGRVRTQQQRSLMLIPPFFRFSSDQQGSEWMFPWPFLQRSTGKTEKLYLWPLWGRKSSGVVSSAFFLWPLGRLGRQDRGDMVAVQRTFFPLYYSRQIFLTPEEDTSLTVEPSDTAPDTDTLPAPDVSPFPGGYDVDRRPVARYEKVWPFYSYQRSPRGAIVRVPDLWPGRPFDQIERNWSAFWTLYSRTHTPAGRRQELLWGLFRRSVDADGSRRTQLFPLLSWERDADAGPRHVSLLRGLVRVGRNEDRWFGTLFYGWRWGNRPEEAP